MRLFAPLLTILCFKTPFSASFALLCDIYEDLGSSNYLRSARFVLFPFHIHFHNILEKLEVFHDIIHIIIDDFVF